MIRLICPSLILFSLLTLELVGSRVADIDDRYLSVSSSFIALDGDISGKGFSIGAINQPVLRGENGPTFLANYDYVSLTDYHGLNLSQYDAEAVRFDICSGFIFKTEFLKIMPYFGYRKLEIALNSSLSGGSLGSKSSAGDIEGIIMGLQIRKQISDSAILAFDIIHSNIKTLMLPNWAALSTYSEPETSYDFDIELKLSKNTYTIYGIDVYGDSLIYSLGIGVNY